MQYNGNRRQGPTLWSWLTSHMPRKVEDDITYPFPNLGITCNHAVAQFVLYCYGDNNFLFTLVFIFTDDLIFSTFN